MTINSVGVCGAGTMGCGIAQVTATAGLPTVLYELNSVVLEKAKQTIARNLEYLVQKGKLTIDDKNKIFSRLLFTNEMKDCKADLIVEAIVEKPEAKIHLFHQLVTINSKQTIYTSNTSSLSINGLAKEISSPHRFAGLHFFNPAPVMKLVEIVKGEPTSLEVIAALTNFTQALNKTPVHCKDAPGFIVNRVARPFYIESLRLAEKGTPIQIIDRLLEDKGFKMGPFTLMDLIGNDINYAVSCSVYEQLGKPERLKPSFLQKEKVQSGALGKKTGKGYYTYNNIP